MLESGALIEAYDFAALQHIAEGYPLAAITTVRAAVSFHRTDTWSSRSLDRAQ